jgi:type II secretory pathway pseudopilin PulG
VQYKQTSIFLILVFVTLAILGILAAVAIPHVSDMVYQSTAQERESELLKIRAAVEDMLRESPSGKLISIGPVTDLALVHTADTVPLALTDYLPEDVKTNISSGCRYSFTSDGIVMQYHD